MVCGVVCLGTLGSWIPAASGAITFSSGVGDVLVEIDPNTPEDAALLNEVRDSFTAGSEYFWNATEKQQRFGNVRVIVPEKWTPQSSYQSLAGIDASAWDFRIIGTSALSTSYTSGTRVYLYRPQLPGGRVIVHELGHALYDLGDEYCRRELASSPSATATWAPWRWYFKWGGEWVRCTARGGVSWTEEWMWVSPNPYDPNDVHNHWPGETLNNPADNHASIMWYQWDDPIRRFCGADPNDPSNAHTAFANTEQDRRHGHSCWDEMIGKQGLGRPGAAGTTTIAYAAPTVTFHQGGTRAPEIMLLLDRSGSMGDTLKFLSADTIPRRLSYEQCIDPVLEMQANAKAGGSEKDRSSKMEAAKSAASQFVDLADVGRIGVAAYSTTASLLSGLLDISVAASKTQLKSAISGLYPTDSTSIGAGLQVAYNELHSHGDATKPRAIVLLTDGLQNTSPDPSAVMPSIMADKITLYTIGLGRDVDSSYLQGLAAETPGGAYYFSPSQQDLVTIYQAIRGQSQQSAQTIGSSAQSLPAATTQVTNYVLDSSLASVSFTLTASSTAALDLVAVAPDGTRMDQAYAQANPTLAEFVRSATYLLLKIKEPMAGQWQVENINRGTSSINAVLIAGAEAGIRLAAATAVTGVKYPEPVRIIAKITRLEPIIMATGEADIVDPNGVKTTIPLNDLGLNGDRVPYDGQYEGLFSAYTGNGVYTITVRVNNNAGTAAEGPVGSGAEPEADNDGVLPPDKGRVSENFQREAIAPSVTVSGYKAGVDKMPPGDVDTLSAARTGQSDVMLTWMAPGDDGFNGQATAYDIRYSVAPLNANNWDGATRLPSPPTPAAAGTGQQYVAANVPAQTLFFALRATDDANNVSDLSNVASAAMAVVAVDSDGDGTPDSLDGCPDDPDKTEPGTCGSGIPDVDSDGDGTLDCQDGCPEDPLKTAPGACGCGIPDTDTDGDGTPDCNDGCPTDPNKTAPGACGCGVADNDTDGDGVYDCEDNCPTVPNPDQADSNGDGIGDACSENQAEQIQPAGCGAGGCPGMGFTMVTLTVFACIRARHPSHRRS
jgi:hypothetical protein